MAKQEEKNVRPGRSKEAKRGWFSKQHETGEANRQAREAYQAQHDKAAKRERAKARIEARARRSPEEQLANVLDRLETVGGNAEHERERLEKQIFERAWARAMKNGD